MTIWDSIKNLGKGIYNKALKPTYNKFIKPVGEKIFKPIFKTGEKILEKTGETAGKILDIGTDTLEKGTELLGKAGEKGLGMMDMPGNIVKYAALLGGGILIFILLNPKQTTEIVKHTTKAASDVASKIP